MIEGIKGLANLEIDIALIERQAVAPSTVDFPMLYCIAAAALAEREHGRGWIGLEAGRVGSVGANEISASRPLGDGVISGESLAGALAALAGTVVLELFSIPCLQRTVSGVADRRVSEVRGGFAEILSKRKLPHPW